ncbi:hypothetical protein MKW92_031863 [Papaver armeniacum]|nr:hypothetical protein MKW92_031863 [Papaver armeniacum]
MKLAVQTNILSKRWRYIWTSLPTLHFQSHEFQERQWFSSVLKEISISQLFVELVDSALILRDQKSDIEKFHLNWNPGCSEIVDHLDKWITAALNRNVVELSRWYNRRITYLDRNCYVREYYQGLESWDISQDYTGFWGIFPIFPINCLRVLGLLTLKSLDIDNANNLFLRSNCNCCDVEWINIESLTLKHLELKNCIMPKKFKLNVPNLQTFVCEDYTWREYSMENISSLVCAHIEMLDFSSQRYGEHYLKLPAHEKELCATPVTDFLKALDTVNELHWKHILFPSNTILNEDLTKHRISYDGNTK